MTKRLFVHIPKNGGMAIRRAARDNALGGAEVLSSNQDRLVSADYYQQMCAVMAKHNQHPGTEHARWRDWSRKLRDEIPAFAVVRNPWSRTVSRYTFMMRSLKERKGWYQAFEEKSFREFLDDRLVWGGTPYFWHRAVLGWYQQKDYVTDKHGVPKCDILRWAHFDEDVRDYFKLTTPLPLRNVSNGDIVDGQIVGRRDYREFYGPEEYDIVAEWYAEDIEFFGFGFEGAATKQLWSGLS